MAIPVDETHDVKRKSWLASANGHADFPLQNLPLGIFSVKGDTPRGGVAIGDEVFDLKAACEAKLFSGDAEKAARAASNTTLNDLMAMGAGPRAALRKQLSALLAEGTAESQKAQPLAAKLLHKAAGCTLHLPAKIGAFTASPTPKTAASGAARIRRLAPITNTCRWPITAVLPLCVLPAWMCAAPMASAWSMATSCRPSARV